MTAGDTNDVVDALSRFAAGQDLPALFRSAFAPRATVDVTQLARRLGGEIPVLVRDGARFVIETMVIRNLSLRGDPGVVRGASPELGVLHVRSGQAPWIDQGGGVRLAPLRTCATGAGTALLAFDAGGRSPAHRHPGGEDLCVVSGRLRVGRRVLDAGDFLHTPPGGVHDAEPEAPIVVLVTVPEAIEIIEALTDGGA